MKRAAPYVIVIAGVALGFDRLMQSRTGPDLSKTLPPTPGVSMNSQAVNEMLKSLETKTTREKIETLYDGAVKVPTIPFLSFLPTSHSIKSHTTEDARDWIPTIENAT
jgi:hypothetical protein